MDNELKLSNDVLMRIVQILQEAIITGTDISDLLYEMRFEHDADNENILVFTQRYKDLVTKSHEDLIAKAERLKAERDSFTGDIDLSSWKTE